MIGIDEIRQMYQESTDPESVKSCGTSPQWELGSMADVCEYAIAAHDVLKKLETHDHDGYDACPDCGCWYDYEAEPKYQPHDDDCMLAKLINTQPQEDR